MTSYFWHGSPVKWPVFAHLIQDLKPCNKNMVGGHRPLVICFIRNNYILKLMACIIQFIILHTQYSSVSAFSKLTGKTRDSKYMYGLLKYLQGMSMWYQIHRNGIQLPCPLVPCLHHSKSEFVKGKACTPSQIKGMRTSISSYSHTNSLHS
jgi:hypothetical protein